MECGKEVVSSPVTEQLKPEGKSHRIQRTESKMDLKKCEQSGSFEWDVGSRDARLKESELGSRSATEVWTHILDNWQSNLQGCPGPFRLQ